MGLTSHFIEDFSTLNNGEIAYQRQWIKTQGSGAIYRSDVGYYKGYVYNNSQVNYENANAVGMGFKVRGKITLKLLKNYDYFKFGFFNIENHELHTGVTITAEEWDGAGTEKITLYSIHDQNSTNLISGDYVWGDFFTVEFMHSYDKALFESIDCNYIDYHGVNLSGSTTQPPNRGGIYVMFNAINCEFTYLEYQSYDYASNKYLKYPRWQPTRYGMRPFY